MNQLKCFYKVFLLVLSLFPLFAMAESISVEPFAIKAGETKDLVIGVENPNMTVTLVQFDLRLPEGLSLASEDGEYLIDIAGRTTWKKHALACNFLSESGVYRFLLASTTNSTITGTEGAVITATIVANDSFTAGMISFENMLLVSPDETFVRPENFTIEIENSEKPIDVQVTVADATRKYGDANPEFTYTVTPADVDLTGKVTLSCDADAKSGVGEYVITVTAAEVEGMVITCENGKLTVTPALLKVTANDATRYVGEANPELTLTYEGFVNDEDESVLIVAPKATTAATVESEAGTYEISVSGGEAANYEFEYKSGTLTILAVDGIDTILVDGRTLDNVYDLKGRLVRSTGTSLEGLTKGVYVVSGRKVVLK